MTNKVYSVDGKEVKSISLPDNIFDLKWNADLVHQVATSILSNKRAATAHTKNRGEVSGGGKKPWKQKGTGRARHGSTRSPIWVGGGVAHGPRNEKDYSKKINYKMKAKALYVVLSEKLRKGEILFLDDMKTTKTKDASKVFQNLSKLEGFERLKSTKKNKSFCLQ
jgi:large subunit ribosomal protein L4